MTKEVKMVLGVVAVVIVFAGIGFFLLKQQNDSLPKISTDQSEALSRSTPNIRGKADSTIKVIEFGDIQCPACAAVNPLMDELYKQYGDRVSFTFRHFPLPMHKNAYAGSDAAEAAGEQGKFWEMVTKLYEVQPIWAETSDPSPTYEKLAQELGLNMDQFSKAYNSKAYRRRIDQDKADGQYLGVNGTPTFYVNGEQILQGGPAQVKNKIEELLKSGEAQTTTNPATSEPNIAHKANREVLDALAKEPQTRVIVTLKGNEFTKPEFTDDVKKKEAVRTLTDAVLKTLLPAELTDIKTMDFVPAFGGVLTKTGLDKLEKNDNVLQIDLDKPVPAAAN